MCHTWIQILNGLLLDRVDLDLSRLMNISSTSVLSLKKNLLLLSISWPILRWHFWSLLPLRYVSKYDCVGEIGYSRSLLVSERLSQGLVSFPGPQYLEQKVHDLGDWDYVKLLLAQLLPGIEVLLSRLVF